MNPTRLVLVGIALLLSSNAVRANPLIPGYFNELQFTSNGWVLEMHAPGGTLDGWSLASSSGRAFFKNGILVGLTRYVILTQDSLLSPLPLNPLGDSLVLYSPQGLRLELRFGNIPESWKPSPREGQSLCLKETSPQFYYLDNSPTLGLPNDGQNAMGTVHGVVTDSLGQPITGAAVWWVNAPMGYPAYTNSSGEFGFTDYAARFSLRVQHPNFEDEYPSVQIWPESTVSIIIVMRRISAVNGEAFTASKYSLSQNHPNPFNPVTTFSFTLPRVSAVTLKVYDMQGREVATVVNEVRKPGVNEARWDASGAGSGVYFYRLIAGDFVQTRKMVLLR